MTPRIQCLIATALLAQAAADTPVEISGAPSGPRAFTMHSQAKLRDDLPAEGVVRFTENPDDPRVVTGNPSVDTVHALACHEARLDAVDSISDSAYQNGAAIPLKAYQTGRRWTYVWTRDTAYSAGLGLAAMDPERTLASLMFKTSGLKPGLTGGATRQIVQDTGSGGSWPVSSDRVIWALGIRETVDFLPEPARSETIREAFTILHETLTQDEAVLRDPADGLFRGEQSFLDWREQSYPGWTANNVGAIAASKSLSTNVAFLIAMRTAARFGDIIHHEAAAAWLKKADSFKTAIHRGFFDPKSGEYSALLLRDGLTYHRSPRRDLLGTSLAILEGVPPAGSAAAILAKYPAGPYGPPVISPQEPGIPIYHNCAIWPFVTAWWTRAAATAGHAAATEAGFRSILEGAERNLSHMENLDFVTGAASAAHHGIEGPVVNSHYQIWSVAGALGVFHSVVFGLETDPSGIRFQPKLPAGIARSFHGRTAELRNFPYLGKRIDVVLELPALAPEAEGFLTIASVEINGAPVTKEFIPARQLSAENRWVIHLAPPAATTPQPKLNRIDPATDFAPAPPHWQEGGISLQNGRATLRFAHDHPDEITFTVLRDGIPVAHGLQQPQWQDPDPASATTLREYTIIAVDRKSGLTSHPLPTVRLEPADRLTILPAPSFQNKGGDLKENSHFMNWGNPGDELLSPEFTPRSSGRYLIRFEFANGAGPVNTGITCAVKHLEVREEPSGNIVFTSYPVFPQSGNWERHDLTVPAQVSLEKTKRYRFRLHEDEWSRNMSYLSHNTRYTANRGGGGQSSHFVDIFALHVLELEP
jgi:hypothetical protein